MPLWGVILIVVIAWVAVSVVVALVVGRMIKLRESREAPRRPSMHVVDDPDGRSRRSREHLG